jgi:hypothetical protein
MLRCDPRLRWRREPEEALRRPPGGTFFKLAQYAEMTLSPDGTTLAAPHAAQGTRQPWWWSTSRSASPQRSSLTFEKGRCRRQFSGSTASALCTRVVDRGKEVSGEPSQFTGLYCIDAEGDDLRNSPRSRSRRAAGARSRSTAFVSSESDELHHGHAPAVDPRSSDAYRIQYLGRAATRCLTQDSPGDVTGWVLDRNLVPRIA